MPSYHEPVSNFRLNFDCCMEFLYLNREVVRKGSRASVLDPKERAYMSGDIPVMTAVLSTSVRVHR